MRVSQHSGRDGSARHNDRDFKLELAPHIDPEKVAEEIYWRPAKYRGMTNEEQEKAYYAETFKDWQEAKNARYRAQRHPEKCKTTEDLRHGRLTRPEETILAIGDRNDGVGKELFMSCAQDYLKWLEQWNVEHGNPFTLLNAGFHVGGAEQGALHLHIRRVWTYQDKDGTALGQNKALEAAGVALPDPSKKVSRYNNRKMTFDQMAREKWQKICKAHGLDIETEPRRDGRGHLRTADYIRQDNEKAQRELERTQKELERTKKELEGTREQKDLLERTFKRLSNAEQKALPPSTADYGVLSSEDWAGGHIKKVTKVIGDSYIKIDIPTWRKMKPHLESVSMGNSVLRAARGALEELTGNMKENPAKLKAEISKLRADKTTLSKELTAARQGEQTARREQRQEHGALKSLSKQVAKVAPGLKNLRDCARTLRADPDKLLNRALERLTPKQVAALPPAPRGRDVDSEKYKDWNFLSETEKAELKAKEAQREV